MQYMALYCHECRGMRRAELEDNGNWSCLACWETILCDECGSAWDKDHDCNEREDD